MKICKGCGKSNLEVSFSWIYYSKYNKSYMDSMCKKCRQEYKNIWARTTEKGRICQKRSRAKEGIKKYQREYQRNYHYTENGRRLCLKASRSSRQREYIRQWNKTGKGKANKRRTNARRRARQYSYNQIMITLTMEQWKMLLEMFDFKCAYCGIDIHDQPTQDHVIPLSKGGFHTMGNIVPSCQICNSSKRDKIWEPNRQWIN